MQRRNISYRPELEIKKQYYTDGVIETLIPQSSFKEQEKIKQLEEIEKSIDRMKGTFVNLPDDIKKIAKVIVQTIELIYVTVDKNSILNPEDEEPDFEINTKNPSTEKNEPPLNNIKKDNDFELSKFQPSYIINIKEGDKIKIINQRYYDAMLQLTEHYIKSYEEATAEYFIDLGKLMNEIESNDLGFVNKNYKVTTTDLKNKELYHVSDFIIRSQILRDQRYRMFNKICSERESLNIVKACETSKELLVRYEKEQYAPNKDITNKFSNMVLYESRSSYEKRIEQNLYNLYKYFNSSVILLGECLKMCAREAEAKVILIKEEGLSL